MILQPRQIAQVAYQAGFRDTALVTAVAVALAESGGDTTAQNWNGPTSGCPHGSTDRGLWQINDCYHAEVSSAAAGDPVRAAAAAYQISHGGLSFHPWSTFGNGRYLAWIGRASNGVSSYLTGAVHPKPAPRPWRVGVGPWVPSNQFAPVAQANWGPFDHAHLCGAAVCSQVLDYEYHNYWSEDHLLYMMYPQGHAGDLFDIDLTNLLTNVFELPTHAYYETTRGKTFYRIWNALRQGRPVISCGYLDVGAQRIPHYVATIGLTPNSATISDPNDGTIKQISHPQLWERTRRSVIVIQRTRS